MDIQYFILDVPVPVILWCRLNYSRVFSLCEFVGSHFVGTIRLKM